MEELKELKRRLEQQRPESWDSLPDLSLYMDQVIGYMPRQLIQYGQGERLTSAMVNNYIKDGLLPRAEGKRYSRDHLAYLTAICVMKQVLPVRDAGLLAAAETGSAQGNYAAFCQALDQALRDTAERLDTDLAEDDLPRLALELALRSYASKLACERVIDMLRQRRSAPEGKARKAERKREL